ncbi:MAG: oxygen-independent coproporphyrinogen III oxidase [Clostridiales bacterium]|nr:oxygen-independent coproporphyrinogen III oxidase [Clostridiales bacterium]
MKKKLGLYIHIPFCVKKCDYCDFLSAPANDRTKQEYVAKLLDEIRRYKGQVEGYTVETIFIGGGTPSTIDGASIRSILDTIREVFAVNRPELSIEVNPGTVDKDKLTIYKEAGINRLSFGLQSANNKELRLLGRIHTYEEFENNYKLARDLGFANINIDLMSALPGQTVASWEETLSKVLALEPEHISAYSLIIEEGTPFYERYGSESRAGAKEQLPDEETERLIYSRTKEIMALKGYKKYEISNYAKEGYECNHNISYWTGREYLGLGLGAASLWKNMRFSNTDSFDEYMQAGSLLDIRRNINHLNIREQMEEFMFLGLRMRQGICKSEFIKRFGQTMDSIYGKIIKEAIKDGVIKEVGDYICLTDYGVDVSNMVLSRFLLD